RTRLASSARNRFPQLSSATARGPRSLSVAFGVYEPDPIRSLNLGKRTAWLLPELATQISPVALLTSTPRGALRFVVSVIAAKAPLPAVGARLKMRMRLLAVSATYRRSSVSVAMCRGALMWFRPEPAPDEVISDWPKTVVAGWLLVRSSERPAK